MDFSRSIDERSDFIGGIDNEALDFDDHLEQFMQVANSTSITTASPPGSTLNSLTSQSQTNPIIVIENNENNLSPIKIEQQHQTSLMKTNSNNNSIIISPIQVSPPITLNTIITTSSTATTIPHQQHLPESPPDSSSEPPYSPSDMQALSVLTSPLKSTALSVNLKQSHHHQEQNLNITTLESAKYNNNNYNLNNLMEIVGSRGSTTLTDLSNVSTNHQQQQQSRNNYQPQFHSNSILLNHSNNNSLHLSIETDDIMDDLNQQHQQQHHQQSNLLNDLLIERHNNHSNNNTNNVTKNSNNNHQIKPNVKKRKLTSQSEKDGIINNGSPEISLVMPRNNNNIAHVMPLIKPEPVPSNQLCGNQYQQFNIDSTISSTRSLLSPSNIIGTSTDAPLSSIQTTTPNNNILLNSDNGYLIEKIHITTNDNNIIQQLQDHSHQHDPNNQGARTVSTSASSPNSNSGNNQVESSNLQTIRFQPFQQHNWHTLCDQTLQDLPMPHYRVDADKGFNFSNSDDAFVCQKKNHFQITCHAQVQGGLAQFVRTDTGLEKIKSFYLHFYGVKLESPNQVIRVEQSQSDRSKKPFHPVPIDLQNRFVSKITIGRLHFSETTSNNMRKKGRPNPEQRYFQLIVGLHAHTHSGDFPIISQGSERIIVRASNPGQFENDIELCWQRGLTTDSIYHAGRVGINTDHPDESLVINGNLKVSGHIIQPSDSRAKREISELDTAQQLKNLQKIRIVRYRYEPEFAMHSGLIKKQVKNYENKENISGRTGSVRNEKNSVDNDSLQDEEIIDTGVIAQELREILPDAVKEAGSIVLPSGQIIENFLLVNKDRILMENIGAVKELCKVTGSLESRIEQLEKINSRLLYIQKNDNCNLSNPNSNRSSMKSTKKKYISNDYEDSDDELCSNSTVQTIIIILIVIMAVCLAAISTLYFVERSKRNHTKPTILFNQNQNLNQNNLHSNKIDENYLYNNNNKNPYLRSTIQPLFTINYHHLKQQHHPDQTQYNQKFQDSSQHSTIINYNDGNDNLNGISIINKNDVNSELEEDHEEHEDSNNNGNLLYTDSNSIASSTTLILNQNQSSSNIKLSAYTLTTPTVKTPITESPSTVSTTYSIFKKKHDKLDSIILSSSPDQNLIKRIDITNNNGNILKSDQNVESTSITSLVESKSKNHTSPESPEDKTYEAHHQESKNKISYKMDSNNSRNIGSNTFKDNGPGGELTSSETNANIATITSSSSISEKNKNHFIPNVSSNTHGIVADSKSNNAAVVIMPDEVENNSIDNNSGGDGSAGNNNENESSNNENAVPTIRSLKGKHNIKHDDNSFHAGNVICNATQQQQQQQKKLIKTDYIEKDKTKSIKLNEIKINSEQSSNIDNNGIKYEKDSKENRSKDISKDNNNSNNNSNSKINNNNDNDENLNLTLNSNCTKNLKNHFICDINKKKLYNSDNLSSDNINNHNNSNINVNVNINSNSNSSICNKNYEKNNINNITTLTTPIVYNSKEELTKNDQLNTKNDNQQNLNLNKTSNSDSNNKTNDNDSNKTFNGNDKTSKIYN